MNTSTKMSPQELRGTVTLALIFFLRMLGLFLILPVFSLYALKIDAATPILVGAALGIYGLTQALFQIPFGMLSDKYGRKPMITLGLILFIIGSLVAGYADDIYLLLIGRALQGAGAIASTVMALAADLTSKEQRTKAMTLIGISVGIAFAAAFILGPILSTYIGLSGLFYVTAILAVVAIAVLYLFVPDTKIEMHDDTGMNLNELKTVLGDKVLQGFDFGIFSLHMILMANFIVIPIILLETIGIQSALHWQVYLPVMLLSIFIMAPFVLMADRKQLGSLFYVYAIGLLLLSQIGFAISTDTFWNVLLQMVLFFTAFNFLEASLPSLISKAANPKRKGTALGVYSTSQFLGAFIGALSGGYLYGRFGHSGVFIFGAVTAFIWFILAAKLLKYSKFSSDS